jgi:hypothetical protein
VRIRGPVAVLAVLALAGCAGGAPRAVASEPPEPALALPAAGSPLAALPLNAYRTTPEQQALIRRAEREAFRQCMTRLRFEVPADPAAAAVPDGQRDRYMLVDAEAARTRGYHPDPAEVAGQKAAAPSRSPAYVTAATGRGPAQVNGVTVPDGGCQGETRARLTTGGDPSDVKLVDELEHWAWDRSQQDSRVVAVFRAWSACMAGAGFRYRSPRDANNDPAFGTPVATAPEIRTAVADVTCKKAVDLAGVWAAVEAAYQRQAVAAHRERLDRIAGDVRRQTAVAAALVPQAGR